MIENLILPFLFILKDNPDTGLTNDLKNIDIFKNKSFIDLKKDDSENYSYYFKVDKNSLGFQNSVKSGVIFDYDTGKIFWSKNEKEVRSIASITKLMTVIVFLEGGYDLDSYIKINNSDFDDVSGAANLGLLSGDVVKVRDLLYSGYIGSKNDAINALVRSTGLSKDDFVKKMNEKAKKLGLNDTIYTNINGLDKENKSTAMDLAKLVYYAYDNDTIRDLSRTKNYSFISKTGQKYSDVNTNKLLDNNKFFTTLLAKTGYIENAGYCLALVSKSEDRRTVSILLGSDSDYDRFFDAKVLNYWVYNNWVKQD